MSHGCYGAGFGAGEDFETRRYRLHLVAMIHPDLRIAVQTLEQRVRFDPVEYSQAVLTLVAFSHVAA